MEYAAAHIQHMQKALMEMNLQLHRVVSDITGATSTRIIRAHCSGRAQSRCVGDLPRCALPSSIETIRAALVGNDRDEHVFAPDPVAGALRHRPGQDARLRSQLGSLIVELTDKRGKTGWQATHATSEDKEGQHIADRCQDCTIWRPCC